MQSNGINFKQVCEMYDLLTSKFNYCKDISWDDIIKKLDNDCECKEYKAVIRENVAPTYILESKYLPGNLQGIFDKVNSDMNTNRLHIYTSFGTGSPTFGRHKDRQDVLLIQALGKMAYEIDNFDNKSSLTLPKIVNLNPGDGLIIKKGIYHNPIIFEPRITLSFSW